MKFLIKRQDMLTAAKHIAKVSPTNSPVEVLNGVLIECGNDESEIYLTATNHEASIQYKVKASVIESGSILTRAALLADMLSLLSGDTVELSSEQPECLRVSAGKAVYNVNCMPAKHFPKPAMPFPEDAVKVKGIVSLYKKTAFATLKDNSKPIYQCVKMTLKGNTLHAAACDTWKIMYIKGEAESTDNLEFLLPIDSFRQLASVSTDEDVYEVGEIGKEVVFTKENMIFSMKKITGTFLDITQALKSIKPKYTAMTDARALYNALDVISVGAGKQPVNLVLSDGQIIIKCDGDIGAAQMFVFANVSENTTEAGFLYNPSWLLKALQVFIGKVKLEIDENGFLLIKNMNEVYMQLPLRNAPQKMKKAGKQTNDETNEEAA